MYERILVPIDGSATAGRGLDEALALAQRLGSSLVLLHVVDCSPLMIESAAAATWERLWSDLRQVGRDVLEAAHRAASEHKVASEAVLEDVAAARVSDVIVDQAVAHRCGLIVMGTHGRRGIGHALIGSDAERVVRHSSVPVLLVRSPDAAPER